jgi:hypothetical protein
VSLIVGNDEPTVSAESGSSAGRGGVQSASKRWVSFAALVPPDGGTSGEGGEPKPLEGERFRQRFHLEAVHIARGSRQESRARLPAELVPGSTVLRRELAAARRPAGLHSASAPWLGVLEPRHSSSDEDIQQLLRQWHGNPFRVAMLLACTHSRALLDLRPEERSYDHLAAPDASSAARLPALRRVVRQLHRAAAAGDGEWDTFVYFEMLPVQVAYVREYLCEQRDNPRTARLVEREVELWMIKQLDGSEPPPPNGGGQA